MIIVIGEALIDLIEDKSTVGRYQAVVGGANANVAIALARAGAKQQLLARISNDSFGQKIRQRLVQNSVGLDYAVTAKEPSSVAIASIGASGGASYSFYVENTADWGWTPKELPTAKTLESIGATALQLGCLSMAMPPGNAVIEAWAKSFFDEDLLTISHDINVRPALGFERDIERIRVERVNSFSHVIKASDDDIAWLYGLEPESSVDQIVWDWIGQSERIVFVTMGGEGVNVYRKDSSKFVVPSRKIQVQDTVGAGDTFCAHTLNQLDQSKALGRMPFELLSAIPDGQICDVVRVANIAASMTCEMVGADPPNREQLETLLATL